MNDIDDVAKKLGPDAVKSLIGNAQEIPAAQIRADHDKSTYGHSENGVEHTSSDVERIMRLTGMLDAVRFDINNPPPDAPPVFKLGSATIATAGNLVAIQAQAKAGTTAQIGAMLAATMKPAGDCLNVWSENPQAHAVLHFDTEQSRADHHRVIKRALGRAGRAEPPPWLRSFCLTGMTLKDRNAAMRFEIERASAECGGIHSVFLDGLADFAVNPNDPPEAFALIDEVHQLAIKHATVIVCVLHENPGENISGKTRGHLGSQLERKAETNLRLSKDAEGITVVYAERARHTHIPKGKGPCFAWSDEAKMHVTTETKAQTRNDAKHVVLRELSERIFKGIPPSAGLSWENVHKLIEEIDGIGRSGARKKFDKLRDTKTIRKCGESYFLA